MAAMDEVVDWAGAPDVLVEQIAPRFRRIESRRRVGAYLQGLSGLPGEKGRGLHRRAIVSDGVISIGAPAPVMAR